MMQDTTVRDPSTPEAMPPSDLAIHQQNYDTFVKGVVIFAAHVAVILAFMAYFLT